MIVLDAQSRAFLVNFEFHWLKLTLCCRSFIHRSVVLSNIMVFQALNHRTAAKLIDDNRRIDASVQTLLRSKMRETSSPCQNANFRELECMP